MKIFVAFALCYVAVFCMAVKINNIQDIIMNFDPDFESQILECVQEMKLDTKMLDPKLYKEAKLPSVEVQACFVNCVEKKMGLLKSDGTYNESFAVLKEDPLDVQQRAKGNLDARVKRCRDAVGTDNPCKMSACFHNMPEEFWQ